MGRPSSRMAAFDRGAVADHEDAERVRVDVLGGDASDVLQGHGFDAR